MNGKNLFIFSALATFLAIALALVYEVFYVRRRKLHSEIASLVGSHMSNLRSDTPSLPPMPFHMLERGMNQKIHDTDELSAKESMTVMQTIFIEAKRRNFLLPLVHQETVLQVLKWSAKNGEVGEIALKLLPYIKERHAQHMDQVIAQSHNRISEDDPDSAAQAARSLAALIDMGMSAGMKIEPRIILFNPNKSVVESWAKNEEHPKTKAQAQTLLDVLKEAETVYNS